MQCQLLGECLKLFLEPINCAIVGFTVQFPNGETIRIFIDLRALIQDLAAHQHTWHCVGSSGHKFCNCCLNISAKPSKQTELSDDGVEVNMLVSDVIKASDLHLAKDEDVFEAVDLLKTYHAELDSGAMKNAQFKKHQTALGYSYHRRNLLYDTCLRRYFKPARVFMHDWMHVLAVSGVINSILYYCFETFSKAKFGYEKIHEYLQKFNWPDRVGSSHGKDVFCPDRVKSSRKAKKIKMMASEALGILPVIALYVVQMILPSGLCDGACQVIITAAKMMDLLRDIPLGTVTSADLAAAVSAFLEAFVSEFGYDRLQPKFHALLHLPIELFTFGFLLSCWVHERKHRMVKRYAQNILNTLLYEASVLGECTCQHLNALWDSANFNFAPGLIDGRDCSPTLIRQLNQLFEFDTVGLVCKTARVARYSPFGKCSFKDVVFFGTDVGVGVGEILLHLTVGDMLVTVISVWEPVEFNKSNGYALWNVRYNPQLVNTTQIIDEAIHNSADGQCVTILPRRLR